jgi:hypothetical protein
MIYGYLALLGILVVFLAFLIDLGVGGLLRTLLDRAAVWRMAMSNGREMGDGWGTALGFIVALMIGFMAWGYYKF